MGEVGPGWLWRGVFSSFREHWAPAEGLGARGCDQTRASNALLPVPIQSAARRPPAIWSSSPFRFPGPVLAFTAPFLQ